MLYLPFPRIRRRKNRGHDHRRHHGGHRFLRGATLPSPASARIGASRTGTDARPPTPCQPERVAGERRGVELRRPPRPMRRVPTRQRRSPTPRPTQNATGCRHLRFGADAGAVPLAGARRSPPPLTPLRATPRTIQRIARRKPEVPATESQADKDLAREAWRANRPDIRVRGPRRASSSPSRARLRAAPTRCCRNPYRRDYPAPRGVLEHAAFLSPQQAPGSRCCGRTRPETNARAKDAGKLLTGPRRAGERHSRATRRLRPRHHPSPGSAARLPLRQRKPKFATKRS